MTARYLRLPSAPGALASAAVLLLAASWLGCQSSGDAQDDGAEGGDLREEGARSELDGSSPGRTAVPEGEPDDGDGDGPDGSGAGSEGARPEDEQEAAGAGEPGRDATQAAQASASALPTAPAQTFAACFSAGDRYSDCETLYITMTQTSPARCVQLTLDTCGTYGRQGFAADVPGMWRIASGSVGAAASPCELGVFYSGNASVTDATGSVAWDEAAPSPTDLVLDLALQLSGAADAERVEIATVAPLSVTDCEE